MSTPKVSVLIPTYNYGRFLDDAIQSVLDQTFTDFELIITDNQSTDGTKEIVSKYLNDPRVHYYQNESNLGMIPNFNLALSYSKGQYIKYLMGDDKFHPELLEKFVSVLDIYNNVSLVTSYREIYGTNSMRSITPQDYPPFSGLQKGEDVIYASLNSWNWIGEPTTVMFRKADLECTGIFNPKYGWYPDWDLWFRLLQIGDCYIIPETLSYFRRHEDQITVNAKKSFRRYFEEYEFYKDIQEKNDYNLDLSRLELKRILRQKAYSCTQLAPKLLVKINDPHSRQLFSKSVKIGYTEKVLLPSFLTICKNFIKKKFPSMKEAKEPLLT